MANYSQPPPPYGMPFPFAPQQPAPAPQVDGQGGPSDPRQPQVPSAEAFQQMWNWNLNQQAYGQNSQQPSYPMWPPPSLYQQGEGAPLPFPPPFLTQNGFVPPPPPASIFYPPPPLPQAHAQNTPASSTMRAPVFAPTPIHPAQPLPTLNAGPPRQSMIATNDRVVEMMDSDKEDGEVSDGDRTTRSPAVYSRPVVEPPRSVPQGPREPHRNINGNGNEGRGHDYTAPSQPSQNDDHQPFDGKDSYPPRSEAMSHAKGLDNLLQKRDDAMRFVRDLHDHRIGYISLAAEGLDPQLLKDLYRRSNVPLPQEPASATAKALVQTPVSAPIRTSAQEARVPHLAQAANQVPVQPQKTVTVPEPKTNGAFTSTLTTAYSNVRYPKPPTTDAAPQIAQTKPTPALKTNITQTPPVKSAPSPIDRKDYIARLQAAKMAKQSAGNKVTPPQQTPPPKAIQATDVVTTTVSNPPQSSISSNGNNIPKPKQPVTEEEKARKTELIRQRLEAMRAKKIASSPAAPQASKSVTPSATTTAEAFLSSLQNTVHVQSSAPQPSQVTQPFQTSQTTQSFSTPSFSGIPGLFMNASTSNIGIPSRPVQIAPFQAPLGQPQNTVTTSIKRRAVASDLEEVTTPTSSGPAYTRPLGQSPHDHDGESMIIEVSDDESGGSEMDLDDDQPVSNTVAISTPDAHQIGQQRLRNFPPLTDFPSRSTSVKPASSAVSTPGPQTPATFARKEELQKKEKDLADLKLRLMLKMQEQRQLKAAAAASSPMSQNATKQTDSIAPLPSLRSKLVDPSHALQTNTHTAQVLARESKKRRRAEIESGLPSLEAEIANNTARMAQIAKEMEELKANNEKISQDKEKLVRELESLGIDTEGMPHAELQAKKDEIDQELESETQMGAEEATATVSSPSQSLKDIQNGNRSVSPSMTGQSEPKIDSTGDDSLVTQLPEQVEPMEGRVLVPEVETVNAASPLSEARPEAASLPAINDNATSKPEINGATESGIFSTDMMRESRQQAIADPIQATVPGAAMTEAATPVDDDEDFYSPEPTITVNLGNEATIKKALEPAVESPSEGEIEMSESSAEEEEEEEEEEEYEPEEPQVVHPMADVEGSPAAAAFAPSEDEEMYEPPEPELNHQMVSIDSNAINTSANSTLQPAEEDGAMDISTSSSDDSDESDESDFAPQSASEHANHDSISFNNVQDLPSTVADDAAPHLHFQTVPMVQPAATEPIPKATDVVESAGFVPYESPLRMFKSYRYHPSFSQDVSGGFLSMTYSHQIDPEKLLCQFESVGGTCNDPECTDQHFRGMNISGEKLLVQLGTANPGKTPDEKQLWNDGLRGVLKELRQKNIKDPNGIAVEIAKYRRQFLNDDTRVVNL